MSKFDQFLAKHEEPQNTQEEQIEEKFSICKYHPERIGHYFCITERQLGCRNCMEMFHADENCQIIDLYEIEDVDRFFEDLETCDQNF